MNDRKTLDEREQMSDLDRLRHSCAHLMATAILKIWPDAQFACAAVRVPVNSSGNQGAHLLSCRLRPLTDGQSRRRPV